MLKLHKAQKTAKHLQSIFARPQAHQFSYNYERNITRLLFLGE
jgi:mannose/fructose/N-acetylgalactosamine-specific phosphotransferase system component IID